MQFKTKIAIVVFSTIVAFYAIVGSFISKSGQVVARSSQYGQVQIFDDVLTHIIRDYVDQPDLEKVRVGSLRGLAEGLDPYCAYLTAEQVKEYDPRATRGETGMILSKVAGYSYVVAVLKGTPAEQAGIREGDFIEYIGKLPSRDLSLYDIQQLLSGQPGTSVDLRILHQGQSRKVSVARARITQPVSESRIEEPGIGYIRVTSLTEGKAAEVKNHLSELTAKGVQKILLDLRGSANGEFKEGIALANLFVGTGTLAKTIGKAGRELQSFEADSKKVAFTGPLAIIVDRSTAGPAEIIAAAVRDQKRGDVVGERTFGAGSDQQLFQLADGGALLLTTVKYAPSSGKPFMEEPVQPTEKVDRPAEAEPVLPADDEDEEEGTERTEPPPAPPKPEVPAEDLQLKKAIEVLKRTTARAQVVQKRAAVDFKNPKSLGGVFAIQLAA
jgi:carboxyl-terminal processing protease